MRSGWLLALLCGCAAGPAAHVGPVTATTAVGERVFACSQAGVFESVPGGLRFVADPGVRPFALAGRAAFDDEPAILLVGGGSPAQSGEVTLLDLEGHVLARRRVADDLVYAVSLAPREPRAAAACADGCVHLLSVPGLVPERTAWRHGGPAVAVAFAPDGTLLASAGHDGKILLGAPDGAASPQALLDHTAAVTCLAWSVDGHLLASGARDGKVRLHDRSGRLLHTWLRLGGAITSVALTAGQLEYSVAGGPGSPSHRASLALP